MPSFTWLDETIEHSDEDAARAEAIATKISGIRYNEEQRNFRRQFDAEVGREHDPSEDCECDWCLKANHRCNTHGDGDTCTSCAVVTCLTECESVRDHRRETLARDAERDLELELCEDKLSRLGARMMCEYEHWNEDERYMQYMENRGE